MLVKVNFDNELMKLTLIHLPTLSWRFLFPRWAPAYWYKIFSNIGIDPVTSSKCVVRAYSCIVTVDKSRIFVLFSHLHTREVLCTEP